MSRDMVNSGVPWLNDIPSNWNVERGKNVLVLQKRPVRESDEVVTCFRDGEVILRSLRRTDGFTMSDKEIGYQGINEGDIVIHGMDGFAGAMGVSKSTGKGSPVLVVCSPKYDAIPQYIIYYLRALAMTDVFIALATGIRERSCDLRWNKISELEFILPSSSEQQKIASFLDRKCTEIDEMIALQEKMIEELKAYKQSVITEAVTKGLNPNVPMKESSIEWIGQIPAHWEVKRLKYIGETENGLTYTPTDLCDEQEGTLVLRSSNVQNGKLSFADNVYVRSVPDSLMVRVGDVIICSRNGSASLVGKSALVEENIKSTFGAFMMRFRSKYNSKYINFMLTATISHHKQSFATTTINQLTIGFINNIAMPFIEDEIEQQSIADYLDDKCSAIDNLISIKQQKIENLKEYKKSIIYEYVTGKKEVEDQDL